MHEVESQLSVFNSRTADLETFKANCVQRSAFSASPPTVEACLPHSAQIDRSTYRRRRWKRYIKSQPSKEQLYQRLRGIRKHGETRTQALAHDSRSTVAGKPFASLRR